MVSAKPVVIVIVVVVIVATFAVAINEAVDDLRLHECEWPARRCGCGCCCWWSRWCDRRNCHHRGNEGMFQRDDRDRTQTKTLFLPLPLP